MHNGNRPIENTELKQRLKNSDFTLYQWIESHRAWLFEQSIQDQFPREVKDVPTERVLPDSIVGGESKIKLFVLEQYLDECTLNIVYDYLDIPTQIINAINNLPVYHSRRRIRALLTVELLDIIIIALLDGRSEIICPYHDGCNLSPCLYSTYLYCSSRSTSIIKTVIKVLGRHNAFVRIARWNHPGSCMKISGFAP